MLHEKILLPILVRFKNQSARAYRYMHTTIPIKAKCGITISFVVNIEP